MDFDASDSDDSMLKECTTQRRSRRKGKTVSKEAMDSIVKMALKDHESANMEHAKIQAWQKENGKVSDETLNDRVQSILNNRQKSREKPSAQEQAKMDALVGYDGAFPRKDFETMKEIIESEAVIRQGTLSTIFFKCNDEWFFQSKEEASAALIASLATLKPSKIGGRIPGLIEKNLLKHFLRSDAFLKLLKGDGDDHCIMIQEWLFKVACSADCNDDLSDLGFAAYQAIQKVGAPSISLETFRSLLQCWLNKPHDKSPPSDGTRNISGLRNVVVLAAEFCLFDQASSEVLGDILTQLLLIGLDSATTTLTTTGFRMLLNNILGPILSAIAQKQSVNFDTWCESWSKAFVDTIRCDYCDSDYWLSLPSAVRLVDMTLSSVTMSFRTNFAIVVLLECMEVVGTEETTMEKWFQNEQSGYSEVAEKSLHWKSLCVAYFALHQTLKCFDDVVHHQTRLRSTIESVLLAYCCGNVVFVDTEATKDDLLLQEKFVADFDRTVERLQGGKTAKITSPQIMRADYLLSILHSYNTSVKGGLDERQRVFGHTKQTNLSSFFKPKSS